MVDRPASNAHVPTRLLRRFALLSLGFWRGRTAVKAWGFTFGLFAALLLNLGAAVAVNGWSKFFFDALQYKNEHRILLSIYLVLGLALVSALTGALLQQVRMRFQLRWREWMTKTLVRRWMERRRFYQLSILDLVDNPEARIAEDGRLAIELFVDFTAGVTNAALTAASFVSVLWFIGGSLTLFGVEIPGYLVIAAVLYSGITSFGVLLIGRPLVARVERKAAAEADFRYELTRTRENAETIALIGGDEDERVKLAASFDTLALRWLKVIGSQTRMMLLSGGNNVLAPVIPLLLGAPKYLAGELSLGDLMQAAAAFAQVQNALNWLSDNSLRLADWFASARRVAALDAAYTRLDTLAEGPGGHAIDLGFSDDGALYLRGLSIAQHDGKVMLADAEVRILPGEKVLVKGDSGTGKSTLIRAMAGLWPWGSGQILRPRDARIAFMPQRPYIPLGTLRHALDYPHDAMPIAPGRTEQMLRACGLDHFIERLDDEDHWSGILSGGEQQRLAFARVLLKRPDIIIMDEPTSALDELSQTRMMELLRTEVPDAMVLHVAHRPGLDRFHDREIHLKREGSHPATVEETPADIWLAGRRWLSKVGARER
jgi:putative ATP-binding cassette transporter